MKLKELKSAFGNPVAPPKGYKWKVLGLGCEAVRQKIINTRDKYGEAICTHYDIIGKVWLDSYSRHIHGGNVKYINLVAVRKKEWQVPPVCTGVYHDIQRVKLGKDIDNFDNVQPHQTVLYCKPGDTEWVERTPSTKHFVASSKVYYAVATRNRPLGTTPLYGYKHVQYLGDAFINMFTINVPKGSVMHVWDGAIWKALTGDSILPLDNKLYAVAYGEAEYPDAPEGYDNLKILGTGMQLRSEGVESRHIPEGSQVIWLNDDTWELRKSVSPNRPWTNVTLYATVTPKTTRVKLPGGLELRVQLIDTTHNQEEQDDNK